MEAKKWLRSLAITVIGMLLFVGILVWVVDPYFHFHKPFVGMSYRLYDERYINDGISRHFEFDAMITGTSMAQNFSTTEMDALFGVQSVKETFSGAGFKETSDNLDRALSRNPELKTVVWSIEGLGLIRDKDWKWEGEFPNYLYDDNVFNDVSYLFNKTIVYQGVLPNLEMTLKGQKSTTMDEYSTWRKETGLQYILQTYDRNHVNTYIPATLEGDEVEMVRQNVEQNIVNLANKYPDTTFYLFYPPFSICYWDSLSLEGSMERQFQAEQLATELMLECPNIKLHNFYDQYDVITDLNNYRDKEHYAYWVNSMILEWMAEGTGLLTKDNYLDRMEQERAFYSSYDYDAIYE